MPHSSSTKHLNKEKGKTKQTLKTPAQQSHSVQLAVFILTISVPCFFPPMSKAVLLIPITIREKHSTEIIILQSC